MFVWQYNHNTFCLTVWLHLFTTRIYKMVTHEHVRNIFAGPSKGDMASFWPHVEPNVDWTVKGTAHLPMSDFLVQF